MTITLARENPDQPAIVALLAEADAYYAALYPAESNHLIDIGELQAPGVAFYVARIDGEIGGFGALVPKERWGELKRMYVPKVRRGLGLGRQILGVLIDEAEALGLTRLRLETGVHNLEALSLYRSAGFHEIPPFPPYHSDPLSLFMEKSLP